MARREGHRVQSGREAGTTFAKCAKVPSRSARRGQSRFFAGLPLPEARKAKRTGTVATGTKSEPSQSRPRSAPSFPRKRESRFSVPVSPIRSRRLLHLAAAAPPSLCANTCVVRLSRSRILDSRFRGNDRSGHGGARRHESAALASPRGSRGSAKDPGLTQASEARRVCPSRSFACIADSPSRGSRGFTLIELLIAITILAVITAVIYTCFQAVADSMLRARVSAEETRRSQFLARNLEENFSTAHLDLALLVSQASPGGTTTVGEGADFFGENDDTIDGAADSVTFISTAPLSNGMGIPGETKWVSYSVLSPDSDDMELSEEMAMEMEDGEYRGAMLQASERPISPDESVDMDEDDTLSDSDDPDGLFEEELARDVGWSQPIKSMDLKYYDGQEWVDEWNSVDRGRLPWSVHVRINFAKTEAQEEAERSHNYDEEDDPDFEMVIPVARGAGFVEHVADVPGLKSYLTEGGAGLGGSGGGNAAGITAEEGSGRTAGSSATSSSSSGTSK
jgi:prepilin-type N-terminal cleavage/methylation domain-containing protein